MLPAARDPLEGLGEKASYLQEPYAPCVPYTSKEYVPIDVLKVVIEDEVECVIPSYVTLNIPPDGRLFATNAVVAVVKQDVEWENTIAVESPASTLPPEGTGE